MQHAAVFKRDEAGLKRQRFDATKSFYQENMAVIQASFKIAQEIAKEKKPHTIGETIVKSQLLNTVKLVLRMQAWRKLNKSS